MAKNVGDALSWWLNRKGEDRVEATVAAAHAAAAAAGGASHSRAASEIEDNDNPSLGNKNNRKCYRRVCTSTVIPARITKSF